MGKGVCFICAAFLSTAAPRRGTLPDLEQQPSPKLFLEWPSRPRCAIPVCEIGRGIAPGESTIGTWRIIMPVVRWDSSRAMSAVQQETLSQMQQEALSRMLEGHYRRPQEDLN